MKVAAVPVRGFTLIEMVIVLAVFATIALFALPNYTSQLVRKQVVDALPLIDFMKPPLETAWKTTTVFPADNAAAALPAATQIVNNAVKSATVENGAIHIVFGNRANGLIIDQTLSVRPAVMDAAPTVPVTWVCGKATAPAGMSVKGIDRTTLTIAQLPAACRP